MFIYWKWDFFFRGSFFLHISWRHVIWFTAFTAGRKSAALRAARAAEATWLAGKCWRRWCFWREWQLRQEGWRGWFTLWVKEVKRGGGEGVLCFGGGVGGQWFGICEEQQRCSCASAPWHFPNLITDEDRLPSLYLASTFPNLHRRISGDKARLGKCWHPLENS